MPGPEGLSPEIAGAGVKARVDDSYLGQRPNNGPNYSVRMCA